MKTTPLEKDIEAAIGKYAKSKGCLFIKFTSPSNRAVPDRLIITPNGVIGFLEVKRQGCKPTPLQERKMSELAAQGCNVNWVDGVAGGKVFIDTLLAKSKLKEDIC